jgi:hypothetical protein
MNYLQRRIVPSQDFNDIRGDNIRSNLANEQKTNYFRKLLKLVKNHLNKESQYKEQSQIPHIASTQGTSRRSPPYNKRDFDKVEIRERVMSRARLQKLVSDQTIRKLSGDMLIKLFQHTIAHDETVLNIKLLKSYIKERTNSVQLSGVNNNDYATLLNNITTVHLESVVITNQILEILKNTVVYSNISTIILRKITFSTEPRICEHFLNYLSENTQVGILILDNVGIDRDNFNNFLIILENFKHLELLEFSNFNIIELFKIVNKFHFHYYFMKVIIKLELLNYLIFNNNIITYMDYTYMFNKLNGINNYYVIDLGKDGIYLKYNDNTSEVDNNVKKDEYFMHIIEIDTVRRKDLNKCVDRYYIDFHTYGNKDDNKRLLNFRHKYIGYYTKYLFEKYKVPLTLIRN